MLAFHFTLLTAVYCVLTLLPIAAAMLLSWRLGINSRVWLIIIGLSSFGLAGYVVFWAYYANPLFGKLLAVLLYVLFVAGTAIALLPVRRLPPRGKLPLDLAVPFALVGVFSAAVLGIGFDHAGAGQPVSAVAENRFLNFALPIDNQIPLLLARSVQSSVRPLPRPLYGDWLSSDRPPLQSGFYLMEVSVTQSKDADGVHYQVISSLLQSLWILGMWALLCAARMPRRAAALVLAACMMSGFVIVNTAYVWPKLVTAAFMLPIVAVVFFEAPFNARMRLWAGGLVGAAAGFALLLHGGSAFGILGIALTALIVRRVPARAFLAGGLVGMALLQGTWMVYQHFGDAPGDRLVKWQLAGVVQVDDRSVLTALRDSYSSLGLGGVITHKEQNLQLQVGYPTDELQGVATLLGNLTSSSPAGAAARLQGLTEITVQNFFYLLPTGGLIGWGGLVACAGLLWRRRRQAAVARAGGVLLLCTAVGVIAWCLLLFGPPSGAAIIHSGTYLFPLLLLSGATMMLWSASRPLAYALVGFQCAFTIAVYAWLEVPAAVSATTSRGMTLLGVVGGVVTIATLVWLGRHTSDTPLMAT